MNPTLTEPPERAARSDTDEAIRLMALYQVVSEQITGKTRWLGSYTKLKEGKLRWTSAFKTLVQKLRIWKFNGEEFLRWAISNHELVLDRPNTLNADWLLGKYSQHRAVSMSDAVVEDRTVRGHLDLIRSSMEADIENLHRWSAFMPDYKQRLLNQYRSLSLHFLATDTVFLELMGKGLIAEDIVARVNEVIVALNKNAWFYQQVRQTRDRAIVDAGK